MITMKRIGVLALLCVGFVCQARAETITLVTYYPAPIGAYEQIHLSLRDDLATPCEIGTVAFSDDGMFRVCENVFGSGNWVNGGIWQRNGDHVFPQGNISDDNYFLGIGTITPEFKLTLVSTNFVASSESDSSILARGTFGSGANLTTNGQGTRFIWYPRKAAIRAGSVSGTQWDDAHIGSYSAAFGQDTIASGLASSAFGSTSNAEGNYALAMGFKSAALGDYSVALGNFVRAEGLNATALGFLSVAEGDYSFAFGESKSEGDYSIAMGNLTLAKGDYSLSMGSLTRAEGEGSMTFGNTTRAIGIDSLAMGSNSLAQGNYDTAIGRQAEAEGSYSTALGYKTLTSAIYSIAIGSESESHGDATVSLGYKVNTTGKYSVGMGTNIKVTSFGSFGFGQFNRHLITSADNWGPTDPVFIIGNGTSVFNKSNALTVLKNGNVGIGTDSPKSVLCVKGLSEHANNAAAKMAGLTSGAVYRTGDVLKIVH